MSGSTIFLFYFGKLFDEVELISVVAQALGVPAGDLGPLMEAKALVPYEFYRYSRGFPCRLELYLGPGYSGPSELELARLLAKTVDSELLISPDATEQNPSTYGGWFGPTAPSRWSTRRNQRTKTMAR